MHDAKPITDAMSSFKRMRDAAVHADSDELDHHLEELVREVRRNPLCQAVLAALRPFNVDEWWAPYDNRGGDGARRPGTLKLPDNEDDQLTALWHLVASMGSGEGQQMDFRDFGYRMNAHKHAEAAAKATSMVVRPFADLMTKRLREHAAMANPDVRELAGVPIAAIPPANGSRIFLSHDSADKNLVHRFAAVLRAAGYQPWIDDHEMPAGTVLDHGLSEGMSAACASIFFITPAFENTGWLRQEMEQAIARKTEQGPKFAIIAVVFDGGGLPESLRRYVWIDFAGEADALCRIMEALPIELGPARWKRHIYRGT